MLGRNPGFTAAAVLCLGLGIGATTAIFSVVNAVLLRPLPYAHADRLVRVFTEFPNFPNGGLRHFWVSPPEFLDLRRDASTFEAIEGWANQGANLAGASEPVRANRQLRQRRHAPHAGRQPDDGPPAQSARTTRPTRRSPRCSPTASGSAPSAATPASSAATSGMNGNPCTVVGVMPKGFAFPPGELDPPELWVPLQIDPAKPGGRGSHFLSLLAPRQARRHPGPGASRDGCATPPQYAASHGPGTHPFDPKNHPIVLAGFQDEIVRGVRSAMLVLLGAVGFVLLIACVNVANLLLARSEARRREIAVRAAIGAGLGRLLQQFIIEGVLLSLAGAALRHALAFGGLRLLVATNAGSIPRVAEIGIDWQVLLFTLAISVATGVVFGLAPVIHMRGARLHDTLKATVGRATGAVAANRFRAVLVTGELALALVLLIGSGLMVKAFWKLQEVDAGMNPDKLLTMRLSLPARHLPRPGRRDRFLQLAGAAPQRAARRGLRGDRQRAAAGTPHQRQRHHDRRLRARAQRAHPEHRLLEFGLRQIFRNHRRAPGGGPLPQRFRRRRRSLVVVVNQTMARTYWPHESALGHRVRTSGPNSPVAHHRRRGGRYQECRAGPPGRHGAVLPLRAGAAHPRSWVVVRTQGDPMALDRRGARRDPRPGSRPADFEHRHHGRRDVDGARRVRASSPCC